MHIAWWQIALITLYAGYQILDELQIYSSLSSPVFAGFFVGLVMGDIKSGLLIGAGMQLMVLGVGTFGGASRIDANTGTVVAAAFSIGANMNAQAAIAAVAVPVASLMIYLDILARFTNTFFAHRIDAQVEKMNYKSIERYFLAGALPWALSRMIPVCLGLTLGGGFINMIVKELNGPWKWLGDGLTTAGAVLPAVGFAILLRYLPVKKHYPYLILGFVITMLFSTLFTSVQTIGAGLSAASKAFTTSFNGISMLAIAMIGFALAAMAYQRTIATPKAKAAAPSSSSDSEEEGEIEDDEL
ncbi:PTS mannose/fructose/sorbose/N-acetylgalactosamine transporter subunit IIC [Lacticaseibacillus zhaodongensis]|uniref:PTS mannose/fructose/sorbose/N-acetylgalactosamine transporter subunit IIC n=1 Tax=Lacticaseibacillus zhaodongensis TaxID=2668065 RepID=UPI0012D35845|nr:PTS sugar transporter subunit IIC [Lacticaseibacillus zhaodongensis]